MQPKRFFDFLLALFGITILLIPSVIIAIVIALTSGLPIFYLQKRIGRYGKPFTCAKFRTMSKGADKQGSITSSTDSRITNIGKFLRKTKLDELPQLWNVLIGNMSFVGPRPDVPGYADKLEGEARKILNLRPGITGPASLYFRYEEEILAQVNDPKKYNDEVIWPKKVEINLAYIADWSFWKDIGYIVVTVLPSVNRWLRLVPNEPRIFADIENNKVEGARRSLDQARKVTKH